MGSAEHGEQNRDQCMKILWTRISTTPTAQAMVEVINQICSWSFASLFSETKAAGFCYRISSLQSACCHKPYSACCHKPYSVCCYNPHPACFHTVDIYPLKKYNYLADESGFYWFFNAPGRSLDRSFYSQLQTSSGKSIWIPKKKNHRVGTGARQVLFRDKNGSWDRDFPYPF